MNFILTVYADPSAANGEDIAVLSPVEALSLGLALSLDSAAAGFGAGMMVTHLPLTILLSLLLNTAAVLLGSFLGRTLALQSGFILAQRPAADGISPRQAIMTLLCRKAVYAISLL